MSPFASKIRGLGLAATDEGLNVAGVGCLSRVSQDALRHFDLRQFDLADDEAPWFCLSGRNPDDVHIVGCARPAHDFRGRKGFIASLCVFARSDLMEMGFKPAVSLAKALLSRASETCLDANGEVSLARAGDVLGLFQTQQDASELSMNVSTPAQLKVPPIWRDTMSEDLFMDVVARAPDLNGAFLSGFLVRENAALNSKWEFEPNFFLKWLAYFFEGGEVERARLAKTILNLEEENSAARQDVVALKSAISAAEARAQADAGTIHTLAQERDKWIHESTRLKADLDATNRAANEKVSEFERANADLMTNLRQAYRDRGEVLDEEAPSRIIPVDADAQKPKRSKKTSAMDGAEPRGDGENVSWGLVAAFGALGAAVLAGLALFVAIATGRGDRFVGPPSADAHLPPWPPSFNNQTRAPPAPPKLDVFDEDLLRSREGRDQGAGK